MLETVKSLLPILLNLFENTNMKKKHNIFEGFVEVCCHKVSFNYWDFESELNPELEQQLEQDAEERAKECITDGCVSGELNSLNTENDEEIRGWWEIEKD